MTQKHILHISLLFQAYQENDITTETSIFMSSEFKQFINNITQSLFEDLRDEFSGTISNPLFLIATDNKDSEVAVDIKIEYESHHHVQSVEILLNARSRVYFYFSRDLHFKEYTLKLVEEFVN